MRIQDIPQKDIVDLFPFLRDISNAPEYTRFIDKLQESQFISRVDAAVLAIVLFLYEKGVRGYGEKLSIVPFNVSPFPIKLGRDETPHVVDFSTTQIDDDLIIRIINATRKPERGTHMCRALKFVKDFIFQELGEKSPTMVILLTDGNPNNPKCVTTYSISTLAKIPNIVLFVIGIGSKEAVNEDLMKNISELCKGEFHHAENIQDLLKWYHSLARIFSMNVRKNKENI